MTRARGRRRRAGHGVAARRRRRTPCSTSRYAGDNIVALSTLYGGTYALFAHTLPQFGIEVRFVDPEKPEDLRRSTSTRRPSGSSARPSATRRSTSSTSTPGPTPPTRTGCPLIVDNTAPTPYLVRPFDHGVDIVVHAATKYIGGHGTSIGGVIVDSGNFDWAAHADRFPGLTKPDPAYHGVGLDRGRRPGGLHHPGPHGAAAQHRRRDHADELLAVPPGPRDAAPAHGAAQRERADGRRVPRRPTTTSSWVSYPGPARQPLQGDRRPDPHRQGVRRPAELRPEVRPRRRPPVHRGARPVQPPGQHRRREVAGDPQRHHHPQPADARRARGRRRARGHGAALDRHRARRRPHRRPRARRWPPAGEP